MFWTSAVQLRQTAKTFAVSVCLHTVFVLNLKTPIRLYMSMN